MSIEIHPSSVVDPSVEIGEGSIIHPFTVIGPGVKIGKNCEIGPSTHIHQNTIMGDNNKIDSFVSIAGEPQDLSYTGENTYVKIGNNNTFREYTHINRGTKGGSATVIGNNCYFMGGVHIGHNSIIEDNVILVSSAAMGGYSHIGHHSFLSAFVGVHQFVHIGPYCMIAALTKPSNDVPPYTMCIGSDDAVVIGLNTLGLKRGGFDAEQRKIIKKIFKIYYKSGQKKSEALEKIAALGDSVMVKEWLSFIEKSTRGITPLGSHRK